MDVPEDNLRTRQLALEEELTDKGIEKYLADARKLIDKGQEDQIPHIRWVLSSCIEPVAEALSAFVSEAFSGKAGRRHQAAKRLVDVKPEVAALITSKLILSSISKPRSLTSLGLTIGSALEMELRLEAWRKKGEEQKNQLSFELKRLQKSGTQAHKHRTAAVSHLLNKNEDGWKPWGQADQLMVGSKMVELFESSTVLIEMKNQKIGRRKQQKMVSATPETVRWLSEQGHRFALWQPPKLPMLCPPVDWTSPWGGGYLSESGPFHMRLVKRAKSAYLKELALKSMPDVYGSLNAMQQTAWQINYDVYEVQAHYYEVGTAIAGLSSSEEIPLPEEPEDIAENEDARRQWRHKAREVYAQRKQRISKRLQIGQSLSVAKRFLNDPIWFPYQLDFRGRVYCLSDALDPQGPESVKALLEFHEGKPIDTDAAHKWLAVEGANRWGLDKATLEERQEWAEGYTGMAQKIADDPYGNREWTEADEPWKFLAWCFEWAAYSDEGRGYISHLPCSVDGTCNGLQHFSAIFRDPIGGRSTNLIPDAKYHDIYAEVAEVVAGELPKHLSCSNSVGNGTITVGEVAAKWMLYGVDRSLVKRSVMIIPYGGTKRAITDYLRQNIDERDNQNETAPTPKPQPFTKDDKLRASAWLSELVWEAIGRTVVAARAAMDWLREAARIVSQEQLPICWETPTGFWVQQVYPKMKDRTVRTKLGDKVVSMSFREEEPEGVDSTKQANGLSPNWIHSYDAAALMRTVVEGAKRGITAWQMVHDEYGTHAADMEVLGEVLRAVFVEMYQDIDPPELLRAHLNTLLEDGEIPEVRPERGTLELEQVRESAFFFS